MEFNVGDIVTLKSGGPKMTVRTVPYEDAGVTKVKGIIHFTTVLNRITNLRQTGSSGVKHEG